MEKIVYNIEYQSDEDTRAKATKTYRDAGALLEKYLEEARLSAGNPQREEFYDLVVTGARINADISREWYNFAHDPYPGYARLCAVARSVMVLFEAKNWLLSQGNQRLRTLAEQRGLTVEATDKLRDLKQYNISRVDEYAKYRNGLAAHYANDFRGTLEEFGKLPRDGYIEITADLIRYVQGWMLALKYIGAGGTGQGQQRIQTSA